MLLTPSTLPLLESLFQCSLMTLKLIKAGQRKIPVVMENGNEVFQLEAETAVTRQQTTMAQGNAISQIKQMEHEGYQFEAADGSLKILMEKLAEQFQPMFDLESFRVIIEKNKDESCKAQATIEVSVGDKTEITAAKGDGPVSALDNALRKALEKFYLTDLDTMRLVDYKVRVIDGRAGTAARVRVMVESRDKDDIWKTIGVSHDIIEASWHALEDSFQYKLTKEKP